MVGLSRSDPAYCRERSRGGPTRPPASTSAATKAARWSPTAGNGRPSVAQQNNETAPRWDGERIITLANFVSPGGDLDARTRRR